MQPADLEAVMAVQQAAYGPHYLEPAEVLAQRLALAPDTAGVVEGPGVDPARALPRAYLVAYRSVLGAITPLHAAFEPTSRPDTLYLHDLAVHPAAAGAGLGSRLVGHALAQAGAEGLGFAALVAVQGSQAFWARQGFKPAQPLPGSAALLAGYGPEASYQTRRLPLTGLQGLLTRVSPERCL